MVVVGADVHKRTHTFVAVDQAGRELGSKTFDAITPGHRAALQWARERFGADLVWAIENCRHLSARRERDLLSRVHELDPAWAPPARSLDLAKHQQILAKTPADVSGIVAELAREELVEVVEYTVKINAYTKRIERLVRVVAPTLLAMPEVGVLTAATLVGETAGVGRFKSEAAFARHTGTAPIPVWSGNTRGRVRLTRSDNRQLNAAAHRIAITQIRIDGLGKTYHEKKKAEGMSTPQALRYLKRRLARIVFNHLHTDQTAARTCIPAAA